MSTLALQTTLEKLSLIEQEIAQIKETLLEEVEHDWIAEEPIKKELRKRITQYQNEKKKGTKFSTVNEVMEKYKVP
jgi:hypothetical protein